MRNMREYAIYRGDNFVDLGTLDELAERTGKTRNHLQWMATCKRWKEQKHKSGYTVILIEDGDDDE